MRKPPDLRVNRGEVGPCWVALRNRLMAQVVVCVAATGIVQVALKGSVLIVRVRLDLHVSSEQVASGRVLVGGWSSKLPGPQEG